MSASERRHALPSCLLACSVNLQPASAKLPLSQFASVSALGRETDVFYALSHCESFALFLLLATHSCGAHPNTLTHYTHARRRANNTHHAHALI